MEEIDYCEITSQLDAREILRYLNSMGINNISGEVLKYFITDLKKLIKYDLQQKQTQRHEAPGLERLHSASTFSSRIRSRAQDGQKITCCKGRPNMKIRIPSSFSSPNLGQKSAEQTEHKPTKRACSCVRVEKPETVRKESTVTTGSSNLIKVPKKPVKRKCDPVSLYHYYTSLWSKYKSNVPGENDWADLRWKIRQKMVGVDAQPLSKGLDMKEKKGFTKK